MLVNCDCRPDLMSPKIFQNMNLTQLDILFKNEKVIEYQYFKKTGCFMLFDKCRNNTGQTIIKIIHCQKCKLSEKFLKI